MGQQCGDRFGQLWVVGPGLGDDGPAHAGQLAGQGHRRRRRLELGDLGGVRGGTAVKPVEVGLGGGVEEDTPHFTQRVVTGCAVDRQRGVQGLVGGQDLLDHDPGVLAHELAEPRQVIDGVGQPVGMVDAQSVDQSLGEPAGHFGMRCIEHLGIFLAQPGQRGDREEAAVPAYVVAPADQLVVLALVDLLGGAGPGARCDRPRPVAEAQHVAVDGEPGDVIVRTQHRQHDSPVGQIPVDIEVRAVRRIPAVGEHIPPPGIGAGILHADVIGHDVHDHAETPLTRRGRQRGKPVGTAECGRHRGGIGDVVAVRRSVCGGQDGGQVQVADPQLVQVVEQGECIGESERVPAHLQSICGDRDTHQPLPPRSFS